MYQPCPHLLTQTHTRAHSIFLSLTHTHITSSPGPTQLFNAARFLVCNIEKREWLERDYTHTYTHTLTFSPPHLFLPHSHLDTHTYRHTCVDECCDMCLDHRGLVILYLHTHTHIDEAHHPHFHSLLSLSQLLCV